MARNTKTIIQRLEEITTPAISRFIVYYYTDEEKRKSWDEFKTCHELIRKRTYNECVEWLTRQDAQQAVQEYHKYMKLHDLSKLYEAMYKKAISGDTQAAKWVLDFMNNSEYLSESADEIDEFLKGVNIPALKGGVAK